MTVPSRANKILRTCITCGKVATAPAMGMHLKHSNHEGYEEDPERILSPRTDYYVNHGNVQLVRGPAAEQECVDCGNVAFDWSHIHDTDPSEPTNYDPRCRSCHKKYDYTDEQRRSVSVALIGKPKSPEHRAKISIARYLEELL